MPVAASAASSMRSSMARPACDVCVPRCSGNASRCAHVRDIPLFNLYYAMKPTPHMLLLRLLLPSPLAYLTLTRLLMGGCLGHVHVDVRPGPCSRHPSLTRRHARRQVQRGAAALHVKVAVVPDETDYTADDAPMTAVVVRCDASSDGGSSSLPDAHSATGGIDWRTAMLRVSEAYPAELPCVEFQSNASGFGSRQASTCCRNTMCCLSDHQSAGVRSQGCHCEVFWLFKPSQLASSDQLMRRRPCSLMERLPYPFTNWRLFLLT